MAGNSKSNLKIRSVRLSDAPAILDIYNPVIGDSAITMELDSVSVADMEARIGRVASKYPWLVATDGDKVVGYAYAGQYRERLGYRWTVEVSVYVHPEARGRGVARQLYEKLLPLLRQMGFVKAYAVITLPHLPSTSLHEKFGFEKLAIYPDAAHKLGRWYDIGFWSLTLNPAPAVPKEPTWISELSGALKEDSCEA